MCILYIVYCTTLCSTLSDLSKWVTEAVFIPPSEVQNLHPQVRNKLDRLLRRIQVVSKPLNYCLLWSQHKGSAVAETVHQCKEVLKQVHSFLAQCNKDKSKLADKGIYHICFVKYLILKYLIL